jgi:hypothetical protein
MERGYFQFDLDDELPQKLKALEDQGWQYDRENKSTIHFNLVRNNSANELGGLGRLVIDETKVHIIRNGKIVG